jgi:hypothetical protein
MTVRNYLVFGDLHGRVLPAFRLASAWSREHGVRLDGLLQVGDLGFFPNLDNLDKATRRHAADDPLELGVRDVVVRSPDADRFLGEPEVPEAMWFTCGNHEDYGALEQLAHGRDAGADDFPVDWYGRLRCIRDGHTLTLPGELRVGVLWGIDDKAPKARRKAPEAGRIRPRSATELAFASFDVLLTHDAPLGFVHADSGSALIGEVIAEAKPAFAFFGHYHPGRRLYGELAETQLFHLHGFEMRGSGGSAEDDSVGLLTWKDGAGHFDYLDGRWLRTFTRHNWRHR